MNLRARALAFPLFLGAIIALWLRVQPLSPDESGYRLEVDLLAPGSGENQLRYEIGGWWKVHEARFFWVTEGAQPRTYRIPLPSGVFHSFEISSTAPGHQVLAGVRIIAPDDSVAARLPAPGDNPNQGKITFAPAHPLPLIAPGERSWPASLVDFVLSAGVVGLVSVLLQRRGASFQQRLPGLWSAVIGWARARPRTALFAVALLAVAMSCHPVVFFGKSFVSPNNGILCLYDVQPTIPGAPPGPVEPWNGSDVYALMWEHVPFSVAAHDAVLRDHELPLWDRYEMCGLTLLGQGQSMIGDPLYWITVLANGAAWAWDLRFLVSKVLFSFGVGLLVWVTVRRLSIAALLGFSCAFIGYFSYRFNHPAFFSLSYAPWMLLCWLQIAGALTLRRAGWWGLALIGVNWVELNSGTAKESAMLMLGMNGIGAIALLARLEPWPWRMKRLTIAAASCITFLAISSPLWVVFLNALRRGFTLYDLPTTNQIAPGLFVGLFDDLFYRQLMESEWHVDPALNFLALLGILWAVVKWRTWWSEPVAKGLVVVSAIALALVFGVVPPSLIDSVPFIKNICHVDDTFICVLVVPLFLLAGFGLRTCLEELDSPVAWRADWLRTLVLLAGLAALYFGTIHATQNNEKFALQFTRATSVSPFFAGYALALFATVALLPWLVRRLLIGRGSAPVNVLAVLLCLVAMHFRHGMWLATKFDTYVMNPQQRVDLQAPSPAVNFVREHQSEPGRTLGFGQILRPGFNIVPRLECISGDDPVTVLALAQWCEAMGINGMTMWWPTLTKTSIVADKLVYDAMNIRYYLASAAGADHLAPGLERVQLSDLDVLESKAVWPRAFFCDRVMQYRDVRQLAKWVRGGDGHPFAAVDAGDSDIPALPGNGDTRSVAVGRDYRLTTNTTSFTVDASGPGVAVLNESYVPEDFRAYINEQRVPYFRVNHIFKGVVLPGAGTWRVRFEYWPHALSICLGVAGGGLVVMLAAIAALCFGPRLEPKT